MTPPIGFVLVTHSKPHQIRRLVGRLNAMFDRPPIACHHDFSQCALSGTDFPDNVSFVHPHVQTRWADFSTVEATVRGLERLYRASGGPDWFVLLSGADYPLKPAERVLHDLNVGGHDAHICYEAITPGHFERDWQRNCHERYFTARFSLPFLTRRLRPTRRLVHVRHPLLMKPLLPYSADFRCFAGSNWFCGNRRTAEVIVTAHRTRPRLIGHYRRVAHADESYFQTILLNTPVLSVNNANWRYTDFSAGKANPKVLTLDDLPALLGTPAHFARKFDVDQDAAVLDALDAVTAARSA